MDPGSDFRQGRDSGIAREVLRMAGSERDSLARLGEDNEKILHQVLGLEEEQIGKLYADGVLVRDPMLGPA
jgi:hypothetical protein